MGLRKARSEWAAGKAMEADVGIDSAMPCGSQCDSDDEYSDSQKEDNILEALEQVNCQLLQRAGQTSILGSNRQDETRHPRYR